MTSNDHTTPSEAPVTLSQVRSRLEATFLSFRDPTTQTDLLQTLKTVIAAVVAWVLSLELGMQQQFLAPWAALLTVHASVYRTFSRGAQQVAATISGVLLSFVVAQALGLGAMGLGVALLCGLLIARLRLLKDEGVTIATTALFVLTTGSADDGVALVERVSETLLGVLIGVAVNMLVVPPLNDRSAARQIDDINRKLGALLLDIAADMDRDWDEERSVAWIERTRDMDDDLNHAWQLVRHAKESRWLNPRYRRSRRSSNQASYQDVLSRLEDGIAQTRSMARTIHESTRSAHEWDPRFREPWLDLLVDVGARVADPAGDVEPTRAQADEITRQLSREDLAGLLWPIYGALISNVINVIDIVDDVASAQPVRT